MTMIKTFIAGLFGALILTTPVLADCPGSTVADVNNQITELKAQGATAVDLTSGEVAEAVEKLGLPPGVDAGTPLFFTRANFNGMSVLIVTTKECFIAMVGPVPTDDLDMKLGLVSAKAKGERID